MTETATATAPAWATAYTAAALAALPADITTATPPQVDEVIRTVQLDNKRNNAQFVPAFIALFKALGYTKGREELTGGTRYQREYREFWTDAEGVEVDSAQVEAAARALPADTASADAYQRAYDNGPATVGHYLARIDTLRAYGAQMREIEQACHAEFDRRGGWTRYWIVANSGGHVHTTMACRTCYATTEFGWPTQLSGADGAGVVEAAGPLTCLTCFPEQREDILADRPVRHDMFETPEQRDERVAREAERDAKLAAKIAKGITPDGKPLVIQMRAATSARYGTVVEIKTARAAELRYVEFAAEAQKRTAKLRSIAPERREAVTTERDMFAAAAATLLDALAVKHATTTEKLAEKYAAKVNKKVNDIWF